MRIVRYLRRRKPCWGVVEENSVRSLRGDPFSRVQRGKDVVPLSAARLLPPAVPGKIILAGLNYKDHARELGMRVPREPVIFLKPPTALTGPQSPIIYPRGVKRVDYEAELAVVVGKPARNIREKDVFRHILGYTCLNDVTARDLQKKDGQWTRSKSFDTFCPVGPWIETAFNPESALICSFVNGKRKQCSTTAQFIFSVPFLVSWISRVMTLLPGDIISTGTPPGVGELKPGDTVSVVIDGIGELSNPVVAAAGGTKN